MQREKQNQQTKMIFAAEGSKTHVRFWPLSNESDFFLRIFILMLHESAILGMDNLSFYEPGERDRWCIFTESATYLHQIRCCDAV